MRVRADESAALRRGFGVMFFSLIYLQKISLNSGTQSVAISLPILYLVLGVLGLSGRLSVSPVRLALFGAFAGAAMVSQIFAGQDFSLKSFIFLLSIYLPFILRWDIEEAEWRRIVALFQAMMVPVAGMVFVQILYQLAFHWSVLSIEPFIPSRLAAQGFMYTAPVRWGHPLMRPNGFFMLEPSFLSAFTASALVLELCIFRRWWRMAWYGAALVASTGATGMVLMAVAAPFILARQRPGVILVALTLGIVAGLVAYEAGALDAFLGRVGELGNQDSSGFGRLVAPLIQLSGVMGDPSSLYTGAGAGNIGIASSITSSAWPIVKLAIEYGLPTTVLFMFFMLSSFSRPSVRPLAVALFFVFNFTGGYLLSPIMPILIMVLVAALGVRRQASPSAAGSGVASEWSA